MRAATCPHPLALAENAREREGEKSLIAGRNLGADPELRWAWTKKETQ